MMREGDGGSFRLVRKPIFVFSCRFLAKRLLHRPTVISAKDLPPPAATGFKLYDAVLSPDSSAQQSFDAEMENFLPLLNDYLKCA